MKATFIGYISLLVIGFVSCQSSDSLKKENSAPLTKVISELKNPAPVFTTTVSGAKGGTIKSPKGTEFTIPKGAFVNAQGEIIEGEVSIQLKEYNKAEEILLSGIPMTYKDTIMESDGMFDIKALANGQDVQLASGKTISVNMPASDTTKNDYKLFYLDPKSNSWKVENKSLQATQKKKAKKKMDTLEVIIEWSELTAIKRTVNGKIFYLFPIEEREMVSGVYTKVNDSVMVFQQTTLPSGSVINGKSLVQLKALTMDVSSFPELSMYKNMQWDISDETEWKKWNAFCKNDTVMEAKILNRQFPGNSFLVALKGKKYSANVVMDYVSSNESYAENREMYLSLLKERPFNPDFAKEDNKRLNRNKNQMLLSYSFSISKLGIWNCDRLYLMTKQAKVNLKLVKDNVVANPSTIYLIDKNLNSVISYYSTMITYNPDSRSILFFISEDGNLCYVKPEVIQNQFPGASDVAVSYVEMKEVNDTEAIRKVINGEW